METRNSLTKLLTILSLFFTTSAYGAFTFFQINENHDGLIDTNDINQIIDSSTLHLRKAPQKSLEFLKKAMPYSRLKAYPKQLATIHYNLALAKKRLNKDSVVYHYDQAQLIAKEGGHKAIEIKSNTNLAIYLKDLGLTDRSDSIFESVVNDPFMDVDSALHLRTLINYGLYCLNRGNSSKAIEQMNKAILLSQELDIEKYSVFIYTNLGRISGDREDYKKSLEYYKKAFELVDSTDINYYSISNNIGNQLIELEQYDSVGYYFNQVLNSNKPLAKTKVYAHLGLSHYHLKIREFQTSIIHAKECHEITKSMKQVDLSCLCEFYGASSQFEVGQVKAATNTMIELEECLKEHYPLTSWIDYQEYMIRAKLLGSNSPELDKDFQDVIALNDSLKDVKITKQLQLVETEFRTKEKELQNQILHSENQQKQSYIQTMWLWSSLLFSLICSALGFFWFRSKALSKDKELIQLSMNQLEDSNKKLSNQLKKFKHTYAIVHKPSVQATETQATLSDDLKLIIPNKPEDIIIQLNKVVYVKSDKNYVDIFVEGRAKPITYRATLKGFISEWLPDNFFVRIHKGHVVNKNYISNYDKKKVQITLNKQQKELAVGNTYGNLLMDKMS